MHKKTLASIGALFLLVALFCYGKTNDNVYVIPHTGVVAGKWGQVNLATASAVTGVLAVANGGTGQSSFATGALSSNGSSIISGTLAVSNGGTGVTASTGTVSVVLSSSPTISAANLTGTTTFAVLSGASILTTASVTVGSSGPILQKFSGNSLSVLLSAASALPATVSYPPSTSGLMIVRGAFSSTCSLIAGEGFAAGGSNSSVTAGAGCTATFTIPFQDNPVCTCTATGVSNSANNSCAQTSSFPTSSTAPTFAASAQVALEFICIGQRNSSN